MKLPDRSRLLSQFVLHGGRLETARVSFPHAPEPWIDLSTGISPWPYPIPELSVECWHRLPDPRDLEALLDVARTTYHVPRAATLAAVAGTDLAISLLPRLVEPRMLVTIVAPTYSSHEKAWTSAGHHVRFVTDPSQIGTHGIGVVVNPNNPDGRQWSAASLGAAATRLDDRGGFLLVDEAFCDVAPDLSVLRAGADLSRSIVLRSFGKFYGLAGLRLGFIATAHPLGQAALATLSDWPVSGPAVAIGRAALSDRDWAETARHRLALTAAKLDKVLQRAGFEITGGTSLFRLARHVEAARIFERLADRGILVRPFADAGLLRFGLPRCDEQFARLSEALEA